MLENFLTFLKDFLKIPDLDKFSKELLDEVTQSIKIEFPPSLIFIGQAASGKTSIIEAIFGSSIPHHIRTKGHAYEGTNKPYTITIELEKFKLIITDTVGLGDIKRDMSKEYEETIKLVKTSDLIIFVIDSCSRSHKYNIDAILKLKKFNKKIIISANKLDVLAPTRTWKPPYDVNKPKFDNPKEPNEIKTNNIIGKMERLKETFSEHLDKDIIIIPTAAPDGDMYWNIDELRKVINDFLPDDRKKLEYLRALPTSPAKNTACSKLARAWMGKYVTAAMGIAVSPIKIGDILLLTPLQAALFTHIGYIWGSNSIKDSLTSFLAVGGLGFIFKNLASLIVKVLPGTGVINATLAGAITKAYGETAIHYYSNDQKFSKEELAKIFTESLEEIYAEIMQEKKSSKNQQIETIPI